MLFSERMELAKRVDKFIEDNNINPTTLGIISILAGFGILIDTPSNKFGYHVTTKRKLERYKKTGGILPPVRFFPNIITAENWSKKVNRNIILEIEYTQGYPLPDHKPALWTNEIVKKFNIIKG